MKTLVLMIVIMAWHLLTIGLFGGASEFFSLGSTTSRIGHMVIGWNP